MTTTAIWRRARKDDSAATEVIGFIMAFAISSIVLVVATQAFLKAREGTDHVVGGVELRSAANRVSTRVVQAGLVAQEFPNATLTIRVRLHEDVAGQPYRLEAAPDKITATLMEDSLSSDATTYKLDQVGNVEVSGTAYSSNGVLTVKYEQVRYADVATWTMPGAGEVQPGVPWLAKKITIT